MAKGDREAFRAALKVLGNEESDKKGKVADRKPKPAKRAIVDKDGKGQKASGKAGDEPGKSSAPKRSWKGRERRMPKRKPSSKNSTAKFPVANENDGNWRKAPKSALADRLERFAG